MFSFSSSLFAELQAHKLSRPSDRIDDKIIDKLTFLKATFKESTRITPTAPANARKLFEDIELNGYLIPKGEKTSAKLIKTCR